MSDSSAPSSASARGTRWKGPPRRALVLDDDELIVRTVGRTLRGAGLTVDGTTVPEEALERAQRDPPDVIVSDLHMPSACGAEILTKMATLAPGTLRVLLSADPEFAPDHGSLAAARVHALVSKLDMRALAEVVIAQLMGRGQTPADADERELLASHVARSLSRPAHEDDGHRARLTTWTARIASDMGCAADEIAAARLGAILHDVGQIAVRTVVFARTRSLDDGDRAEIAIHPEAGARIVGDMPALRDALPVIAMHHERHDRAGYPARGAAAPTPRGVLAFQVADAYDAMVVGRHYKAPRTHADAIAVLRAGAGKQHHHDAVAALAALGEEALRPDA